MYTEGTKQQQDQELGSQGRSERLGKKKGSKKKKKRTNENLPGNINPKIIFPTTRFTSESLHYVCKKAK